MVDMITIEDASDELLLFGGQLGDNILKIEAIGPKGDDGDKGDKGDTGKQLIYVTGAPATNVGNVGDFAIRNTGDVYEKTAANVWTLRFNIKGPQGDQGIPGPGDMNAAEYDSNNDGKVNAADVADSAPWDGITDKPAAFPPETHIHADATETDPGFMSAADKTKLDGVSAGATANATDAELRDRSTHTGTQSADTLTDGATNKAFLAAERTKLAGIAAGATANQTDAYLLSRANHTGTQGQNTVTNLTTDLAARQLTSEKGQAGGYAGLDGTGKVPAAQMPSYVDDVLEYANLAAFPGTGEAAKIYVALDTNKTHRWSGSAYVEISASPGSTDAVTEGATNLYFTAARVRSTLLTSLSLLTSTAVIATDTVLDAIGKLQAQITGLVASAIGFTPANGIGSTNVQAAIAEIARNNRNYLINSNGAINQRGVISANDDTYAWDRHYVLTQTGAVGTGFIVDPTPGVLCMMRQTQAQVAAQRMGIAQIVESINCRDLQSSVVTLLGKLRCSSSQAIRYAVLEWTGARDVVTSDVVNSWTNGTFTAGQFFTSTTLNVLAVGSTTPTVATVTDFALQATVGASANNLIVMIWTEGTAAQGVTLDVAWELVDGTRDASAYPLDQRTIQDEVTLCQRYYCKSFPLNTAPVEGVASSWIAGFAWSAAAIGTQTISFPVSMIGIPTITFFKPAQITGTNSKWQWFDSGLGSYQDSSATIVSSGAIQSNASFSANLTVAGATAKGGYIVQGNWTAEAEL
ncbi:hypothetical protein [Mesorhizobium sp. B2-4-1]|uniref:hypothetical protein n=1 Tax=Mesorhizobium sp. B2-4-1 TaxID=2589948 RepID=UPI001AED2149|nr:hypothetical protein [Mesorhizobium sp. B2-4-1]